MHEFRRHFIIYFFSSLVFLGLFFLIRLNIASSSDAVLLEKYYFSSSSLFGIAAILVLILSLLLASFYSMIDSIMGMCMIKGRSVEYFIGPGFMIQSLVLIIVTLFSGILINHLFASMSTMVPLEYGNEGAYVWTIYLTFTLLFSRLMISIDRKLGPGNLWKLHSGKFRKPREENRIFMFIDLRGGTTIAEKIGHRKYSLFLQDCFHDLSVVDKYNAEIYQYVGDEVIISWPVSAAKNYQRFLSAYFAFQAALEKKRAYYETSYGAFPQFKAGAHAGLAIVTEVGEIKRDITYHGDTLNTTARIQGMCNELKSEVLISETLYEIIKPYSKYQLTDVGYITLKGKQNKVKLYKATE